MKEILKKLTKGIKINTEYLEKIKKSKQTLTYMDSQDFDSMPEEIKEMNLSILSKAKKALDSVKETLIIFDNEYEGEDGIEYANNYEGIQEMLYLYKDIECLDSIMNSGKISLSENIKKELEVLSDNKNEILAKFKIQLKEYVEKSVRREFLNEDIPEEPVMEETEIKTVYQRNYIVRKTNKSPQEIKELIEEYIRINEAIFNKIIFESKPATLSISERVLDVYFKPGTGYVINFISEPDTNYGKYYRNLLKVFNEIKEYVFDNYDIVVTPEDGKSISYLNSFYQNYVFVRERIDTALVQFKLQHSLLNENFSVKYLVLEKISGKYLIFFNGNKDLSRAVESYFQNQAKLGTMSFELEFVEYDDDLKKMIFDRYNKIKNKVELVQENNYMKIRRLCNEEKDNSFLIDVTGIKVLIDPEVEYDGSDIDIVIMSNARNKHVNVIPQIMNSNPNAKLFTSDISYKIARIKWLKELNNPNLSLIGGGTADFTRRDVDNLNERVIRITPMGKGYNFRNLINIKFFTSGSLPGSSIVEIMDASQKTIFLGNYTTEHSGLLKGADNEISQYNYILSSSKYKSEVIPLPISLIKERLGDDKQVFIFSDSVGNLQHVIAELFNAGINKPVVSGDATFSIINKELAKLLNFGSSWGDNFDDKELFIKYITKVEPFTDEYEFYKKFSTNESLIFILPFEKMEIEMVLKNKFFGDNLIFVPSDNEYEFQSMLEKDAFVPDECKTGKHFGYNYIRNSSLKEIYESVADSKNLKKFITDSEIEGATANKVIILGEDTEKKIC
ncbi:MAG: MBL fold metallo-hydrolase [Candidatus Delongbacteria bacterium]|nr:MBL fold metallo-hydrolase [Candidatus Delongbacteria bacterium]